MVDEKFKTPLIFVKIGLVINYVVFFLFLMIFIIIIFHNENLISIISITEMLPIIVLAMFFSLFILIPNIVATVLLFRKPKKGHFIFYLVYGIIGILLSNVLSVFFLIGGILGINACDNKQVNSKSDTDKKIEN